MRQRVRRSRYLEEQTTPADFCQVFHQQMGRLYTLALLLTADHATAEESFVTGLADCLNSAPVFKQCTLKWSKRAVIKNAIRITAPTLKIRNAVTIAAASSQMESPIARVLFRLDHFPRFVYILSVLERYSDRECALLLNCTVKEVVKARSKALRQLASVPEVMATAIRSSSIDDSRVVTQSYRFVHPSINVANIRLKEMGNDENK